MTNLNNIIIEIAKISIGTRAIVDRTGERVYNIDLEQIGDYPYVKLKIAPKARQYGIIHVPKEIKGFFPGYRKQFILETDVKPFVMHLTGSETGTKIGEKEGGYIDHPMPNDIEARLIQKVNDANNRIDGSFKRWYDSHPLPEAAPNSWVKIYRIHSELFRLELDN